MASNKLGIPACDIALAELHFRQGKYSQSASLCADCLSVVQWKLAEMELVCWERLADIGFAEKDTGRATRFSIVLLALALRVKDLAATHQAFRRIGDLFHSAGDGSTAQNLFELALSGFTLMDIYQSRGNCLIRLGDISLERREYEGARNRWTEARSMFDRSSQLGDVQRCNERLGKLK
jgi:tetratricopeptide (TPR) repeat protein